MPSIAEYLTPLENVAATLRGKPLSLRAVLGWESARLEQQFPQPYAADELEAATEKHRAAKARYECVRRALLVAISAGMTNSKGEAWTKDRDRAWVESFAEEMWGTPDQPGLLEREIIHLWLAVANIGMTEPGEKKQSEAERIGTEEKQGN